MRKRRPETLLVDDGSLGAFHRVLRELHADFQSVRGYDVDRPFDEPSRLLIAPATIGATLRYRRSNRHTTWLAVVDPRAEPPRALLRPPGFDLLVPRTAHPATLRLLMARALFEGRNTQGVRRVAVGQEIWLQTRTGRERALLVDLSPRGCRLLVRGKLAARAPVAVGLPDHGGRALALKGCVVRSGDGRAEGGGPQDTAVAIAFQPLRPAQSGRLKAILRSRLSGPADVVASATTRDLSGGRPGCPRGVFERGITAMRGADHCQLVACDLSEGGLRVRPEPALQVGVRVSVVIPTARREEPLLASGRVARDDGERGLAIHFEKMTAADRRRLRHLVARLKPLKRPPTPGAHARIPG